MDGWKEEEEGMNEDGWMDGWKKEEGVNEDGWKKEEGVNEDGWMDGRWRRG